MISIKKVAVTPLPKNNGAIIDSFNTSDNKHTNAPSIFAVEEKLAQMSDEKKMKVSEETMKLEFDYRIYKYADNLKTGKLIIPITFYKIGETAGIGRIDVNFSVGDLTTPIVTRANDITTINYSNNEVPTGIELTCTDSNKFKKYNPLLNNRVQSISQYKQTSVNGVFINTTDTVFYSWIDITQDKMQMLFLFKEAGANIVGMVDYTTDNMS